MILINIICGLCMLLAISCSYILLRMCIAYERRVIIYEAIYAYTRDTTKQGDFIYEVNYCDMETFRETVFRLFDFGYTNILPKEKYEMIEPYIRKESKHAKVS